MSTQPTFINMQSGDEVGFTYTNHEGKTEDRHVIFEALSFGANEYYTDEQWFLSGHCTARNARRSFALNLIKNLEIL